MSVPTQDVYADDLQVRHPLDQAGALAPLLGVPLAQLASDLSQSHNGYVLLKRDVGSKVAAKISAANYPGISLVADATRVDPNGELASPLLGTVNGPVNDHGSGGVEASLNGLLAGQPGTVTTMESARRSGAAPRVRPAPPPPPARGRAWS